MESMGPAIATAPREPAYSLLPPRSARGRSVLSRSVLRRKRHDPRSQPYAARTEVTNFATSRFRRLLSFDSDCAAECTWDDASPASDAPRWTAEILSATREVPSAARWTLREISWVAAPCSSTADAIADEISEIRPM